CSHDAHIDGTKGKGIARNCNGMCCPSIEHGIRLAQERIDDRVRLNVRAVVDELADGNAPRQHGHRSEVIAMPVCGHEVVYLVKAGIADGGEDSTCVTVSAGAGISCVDQK